MNGIIPRVRRTQVVHVGVSLKHKISYDYEYCHHCNYNCYCFNTTTHLIEVL